MGTTSLYKRLGGYGAIAAITDDLLAQNLDNLLRCNTDNHGSSHSGAAVFSHAGPGGSINPAQKGAPLHPCKGEGTHAKQ
jgi:hypothetical protein